jgi:prepilin-type N-terminal cleavage/methylation domain-containing protein
MRYHLRLQSGFSFLELIVVVGLIGIVAAFSFSGSNEGVSIQKVISQSQEASVRLANLIASARSAQTSIKISCNSKSLKADYYRLRSSNMISGSLGTSVVAQTSGAVTRSEILIDFTLANMTMSCPSAISYVTSDGNFFTSTSGNFDLIISSTKKQNLQGRILLSKLGFPRVYARDANVSASWTEIRQ